MTRHAPIRADEAMLHDAILGMNARPNALQKTIACGLLDTYGRDRAIQLADSLAGAVANEDASRRRIAAVAACRAPVPVHDDHAPLADESEGLASMARAVLIGVFLVVLSVAGWAAVSVARDGVQRQSEAGAAEW